MLLPGTWCFQVSESLAEVSDDTPGDGELSHRNFPPHKVTNDWPVQGRTRKDGPSSVLRTLGGLRPCWEKPRHGRDTHMQHPLDAYLKSLDLTQAVVYK